MLKNKKRRIAVIVEVKKRELPFMSILQEALKLKGYKVKLIPFRSLCTWRLLFFRPDIVLVNGLRHEDPYFIKQVLIPKRLFKSRIACYYSEQVGYYNQSLAKGYNNKVILDNVDFHIAWGPRFAKDLNEMGVPSEKLWYVGSLQYDIDKYLRKSMDNIKKELAGKHHLPYEKKWILYADNIIESYQPNGLYSIRRNDTYKMVETVASYNDDCHIIFRHHPDAPNNEKEDAQKRFNNLENVSVISDGHIFDWTCAISALIMWVSTSSLQVMFMGKPVFGFMTSDGKELDKYWYKDIFPTFKDSSILAETIYKTLNDNNYEVDGLTKNNRNKYISDWYFKKDGYSFERLCFLMDLVYQLPFQPLKGKSHYGIMKYLTILFYEMRSWIGDIVKNRDKERNIKSKEILLELEKYDLSKFSNKSFKVYTSNSGNYLE